MLDDGGCRCLWHIFDGLVEAFSHWAIHTRWLLYLIVLGILAAGLYLLFATSHFWWGWGISAAGVLCLVAVVSNATDPRSSL